MNETLCGVAVNRIGFEPMACCLEGSCSIQLSYRSVFTQKYQIQNQWPSRLETGMLYPAELPVRICGAQK